MNITTLLQDLFTYDYWSNRRVIETLVPGEATRLFAHIIGSERVWFARIEEKEVVGSAWPDLTIDECCTMVEEVYANWRTLLEHLDMEGLQKHISYVNFQGMPYEETLQDILMHVVNHATYHRAQIARVLREAGRTPASTDYIAYAREERKRQVWMN